MKPDVFLQFRNFDVLLLSRKKVQMNHQYVILCFDVKIKSEVFIKGVQIFVHKVTAAKKFIERPLEVRFVFVCD